MKPKDVVDISGFFYKLDSKLKLHTQDKVKVNYNLEPRE
jgi:hypothetical protein